MSFAERGGGGKKTKLSFNLASSCKLVPYLSFVFLLLLGGVMVGLVSNNAYAVDEDEVSAQALETFGDSFASLTLDTSKIEVTVAPGNTAYASKDITITTNNVDNYTLTVTAPAKLNNTTGGNTYANAWGYAYGDNLSTAAEQEAATYTNFTGSAQTLESGTTNKTSEKTLALSTQFAEDAVAGHYTGKVTLSLTSTPKTAITYTLSYDANGGDAASVPTSQTCEAYESDCEITISSETPTRNGYTFLGWAGSSGATAAEYAAGGKITMSSDETVFAVWKNPIGSWTLPNGNDVPSGITTMQEMTKDVCNNSQVPTPDMNATAVPTLQLTDSRDLKKYTIAKYPDGRCWMTENLQLIDKTITAADSDVSANFIVPASSIAGFTSANVSTRKAYLSTADESDAGVAGYYNWYTATAGKSKTTATTSICPKGWTLPSVGEYSDLLTAAGIDKNISNNTAGFTTIRNSVYNFRLTGSVASSDGIADGTNTGYWWTNAYADTMFGNDMCSVLKVTGEDGGLIQIGYNGAWATAVSCATGVAMRCIARD